jgi:pyridoxamine 5'-phosphate oxidase
MSGPEPRSIRSVTRPNQRSRTVAAMSPLPSDAVAMLTAWLPENDDPVRPGMQLATVDANGAPDVRTVLLSGWDEEGFLLHTDSRSRKVEQLATEPRVALVLVHPSGTRQLVVRGTAVPTSAAVDALAYERRSAYLQRLAWLNTQELAQRPQEERAAEWAAFSDIHGTDLTPPATWAGYLVRPDRITFWQADPNAPSHRVEFRLAAAEPDGGAAGGWSVQHLAG